MSKRFESWVEQAVAQMRFPPDRGTVRRELLDHMEDRQEDYLKRGLPEAEAEEKALTAMGDPVITGRLLNKAHRPWLGWLWILSKILLAAAVAGLVFVTLDAWDLGQAPTFMESQEHPFCPGYENDPNLSYTPLDEVGMTHKIGEYTMKLDHGGWYTEKQEGRVRLVLGWLITARVPWQTMPLGLENMKLETGNGAVFSQPPRHSFFGPDGEYVVVSSEMKESNLPVWIVHQVVVYSPGNDQIVPEHFRFYLPDGSLEYTIQLEEGVLP